MTANRIMPPRDRCLPRGIREIDRGRVLDRGTHHELLTRPGFYRDLFDLQASRMEEARTDLSAASPTRP